MEIEQSRLRLAEDVTFQSMGPGEDTVVLCLSSGYLYTCNETTEAFLRALDGRRSFAEIADVLAETYDAPQERLQADLRALAEEMLREKMIVVEAETGGQDG